ncbi:type II toxin-antitoxin system PrlF family antitoxin [Deinococcus radiomollis]|uniref:AbrB/MazE/SpoVT family DNA-binding domain-containing protein n=1 Tax=Deinococcus radiomollis TaxID=468916 RepID=UPI00389260CD
MRSTLTSKGQTTVPKPIREQLRLDPGAEIDWTVQPDGSVLLRPATSPENPFLASLGAFPLPEGLSTTDFMADLRGRSVPQEQGGPGAKTVDLQEFLRTMPQ